jgi:hypothetical protein
MEVENMADPGAVGDLVDGLNAATAPGTYGYIHTSVLGTDQIKVALIYKPARVTPVGAYMTSANTTFSRAPLAQTFEQISTGETFSVVANHFKSKGCSDATGLDADQNDGQSCYNDRRKQQAQALAAFVDNTVITAANDPDVFILGDLNSYAREDPIAYLRGVEYTDLAAQYGGGNAYSYAFDGQFGYLDYIMPNPGALGQVTGATDWHINADEPGDLSYGTSGKTAIQINYLYNADEYRAADHDPVIVGLNLLGDHSNLAASYGQASHSIPHVAWLGTTVVDEADYGPQLPSDNDGVTPGTGTGAGGRWADGVDGGSVNLALSGTVPQAACVHGWIDWANDGSFNQNEDYVINGAVVAGSPMSVTFTIPAGTFPVTQPLTLHARFRLDDLCPDGPAQPTGSVTGGEVEDYTWNFNPTPVGLDSFTATAIGVRVLLHWVTNSEVNSAGFNLYRAVSEAGERVRINPVPIPAGGDVAGAAYTYTDTTPGKGPYVYWLEEVDNSGAKTLYGPVSVTVTGANSLWLPMIAR